MYRNSTQNKPQYHIQITADHKWFELKLKEVWRYRDLIVLFTKRNFQVRYKQTILGPAWLFLSPFLTSIIYTFVFGGIAKMSTDGIPQILFYLCSTALWGFYSSCITANAHTFTANAGVFGKVYFPRLTVPISNVLSSVITFCIQMILVIVFWFYYLIRGTITPNWPYLLFLPVILVHLGIMGMGFGIIISSMTTKYRDLSILVGFGVSLWMYATPVVYPLSQLEDNSILKKVLMINPVTAPIELFRFAFLGQGLVLNGYMVFSWCITLMVALLGIMIFNHVEKTFMDTV